MGVASAPRGRVYMFLCVFLNATRTDDVQHELYYNDARARARREAKWPTEKGASAR